MKNLYNSLLLSVSLAYLVLNSNQTFANSSMLVQLQQLPQTVNNAFYSVPLTGFNHDVIANGNGQANTTTSTTIDYSNEYFSADFVPTTPYNSASAAAYGAAFRLTDRFPARLRQASRINWPIIMLRMLC